MSGEYKQTLIKQLHQTCEKSRIYIRGVRQDARKSLKPFKGNELKTYEKEIQKETDDFIKEIDKIMAAKETELKNA